MPGGSAPPRNAKNGQVVQLGAGRKIAELELDGLPHFGSGITWTYRGRAVLATPNLRKAEVSVIDMGSWETIERIETQGPGFFMRSHEKTPYAWVDVFFPEGIRGHNTVSVILLPW